MTIEVVSFLVGALFVLIALLGGGIEVKELKVPTVGTGKRIAALIGGLMFIGLGLIPAMWRAAKALAQESAQTAYAAAPGGNSDASLTDTLAVPVSSFASQDAPPPATGEDPFAEPAAAVAEDPQPGFGGFSGSTALTWAVGDVSVAGVTYMNGQTGSIRITFTVADGTEQSVDEDLELREDQGRIWYVGSNARYAGTETAYPGYNPDSFEVVASSDGGWTYAQTCDSSACHPVAVALAD
jgi:hypothetical protein